MSRRYADLLAVRAAKGDVLASRELLSGLKEELERRGEAAEQANETAAFLIVLAAEGSIRTPRRRRR